MKLPEFLQSEVYGAGLRGLVSKVGTSTLF